jgi:hypothetical protein
VKYRPEAGQHLGLIIITGMTAVPKATAAQRRRAQAATRHIQYQGTSKTDQLHMTCEQQALQRAEPHTVLPQPRHKVFLDPVPRQ